MVWTEKFDQSKNLQHMSELRQFDAQNLPTFCAHINRSQQSAQTMMVPNGVETFGDDNNNGGMQRSGFDGRRGGGSLDNICSIMHQVICSVGPTHNFGAELLPLFIHPVGCRGE